jgi:hypothetical protein
MIHRFIFPALLVGTMPLFSNAQFLPDLPERLVEAAIISPLSAERLSQKMPSFHSETEVLQFIETERTAAKIENPNWQIIIRNLVDCGLISGKVAQNLNHLSENNIIQNETAFYKTAKKQVLYDEWLQPTRLLLFLERLSELALLDEIGYKQAQIGIENKQITTPYDFLPYITQAAIINAPTTTDEEFRNSELMLKISRVLPTSFTISQIASQIIPAQTNNETALFSVYMTANGQNYAQSCKTTGDIYKIFNKLLLNAKSDYRVHYIPFYTFGNELTMETNRFGIILLNKYQESILLEPLELSDGIFAQELGLNGFWELTPENYETALSATNIDSLTQQFQAIGLFNHLDTTDWQTYQECVQAQTIQHPLDILTCFPNTIFQTSPELPAGKDPYKRLLTRLKLAAHGDFQPTNITEQIDKQKQQSSLVFSLNGKIYRPQFSIKENYIDNHFWEMLQKWDSPNAGFHLLHTQNTQTALIWLTKEQHQAIKETNILEFDK